MHDMNALCGLTNECRQCQKCTRQLSLLICLQFCSVLLFFYSRDATTIDTVVVVAVGVCFRFSP